MASNEYYVYIMSNWSRTLYVGVTNDLMMRVDQHKTKTLCGFTARYNVTDLVYYESTNDVTEAIQREKQLKGWLRSKKIALIESVNPEWRDLSLDWAEPHPQTLGGVYTDPELSEGECAQGDKKVPKVTDGKLRVTSKKPSALPTRREGTEGVRERICILNYFQSVIT